MNHSTYRQLQSQLKEYRNRGIIPACNVKLNSCRAVLETAIIACIKFERGLCQRKLELNPNAAKSLRTEWTYWVGLNTRKLDLLQVA